MSTFLIPRHSLLLLFCATTTWIATPWTLLTVFIAKGTSSFGKRHNKSHTLCRRCGSRSLHIQKHTCSNCGKRSRTDLRTLNRNIHNMGANWLKDILLPASDATIGVRRPSEERQSELVASDTWRILDDDQRINSVPVSQRVRVVQQLRKNLERYEHDGLSGWRMMEVVYEVDDDHGWHLISAINYRMALWNWGLWTRNVL